MRLKKFLKCAVYFKGTDQNYKWIFGRVVMLNVMLTNSYLIFLNDLTWKLYIYSSSQETDAKEESKLMHGWYAGHVKEMLSSQLFL